MENQKRYDWDQAMEQIDLAEYLMYKFPSFYYDKERKSYVDHPDPKMRSGKFAIIPRHKTKDGFDNFIFRNTGKGGNFLAFIRNHVATGDSKWQDVVNKEIQEYLPHMDALKKNGTTRKEVKTENYNNHVTKEFQVSGKFLPLHQGQLKYITQFRKISEETLNSKPFKDLVKSYQPINQKFFCIGIPLLNTEENIVGVNKIMTIENSDFYNEKLFEPGSDNRLGFSKSNRLERTDKFVIMESTWDSMAHYELKAPGNTEYISSNGEVGLHKAHAIISYIEARGVNNIILANDNDTKGHLFDLMFLCQLVPNLKFKDVNKETVTVSIIFNDNVDSVKIRDLVDNTRQKNSIVKDENSVSTDLCEVKYNKESCETIFQIPNTKEFLKLFNSHIPGMFYNLPKQISIEKADNKDFNDDLKIKKEVDIKIKTELLSFSPQAYLIDIPVVIVERMMFEQLSQGNNLNINIFDNQIMATREQGGFDWDKTVDGYEFWSNVIEKLDYDLFHEVHKEGGKNNTKEDPSQIR